MKKNVMMRLASFLLVAVLISTSAISGTYAKYVTADSGSDMARVAKFGVTVDVAGTMFAESYDAVAQGNGVAAAGSTNITVQSDGTHGTVNDLVAPGTKGNMAAIKITGKPEVDVVVSYEATKVDLSGWSVANNEYYCPLVITIKGSDGDKAYYLDSYTSETEAENVIKEAIKSYSKTYEAGTDLNNKASENLTISWEWPFETWDANGDIQDENDTYLGDSAAGMNDGKSAATIEIEVKCTVTQID